MIIPELTKPAPPYRHYDPSFDAGNAILMIFLPAFAFIISTLKSSMVEYRRRRRWCYRVSRPAEFTDNCLFGKSLLRDKFRSVQLLATERSGPSNLYDLLARKAVNNFSSFAPYLRHCLYTYRYNMRAAIIEILYGKNFSYFRPIQTEGFNMCEITLAHTHINIIKVALWLKF